MAGEQRSKQSHNTCQQLIFDISGRELKSAKIGKRLGSINYTLEIQDLDNGIYMVEVIIDSQVVGVKKIIKSE